MLAEVVIEKFYPWPLPLTVCQCHCRTAVLRRLLKQSLNVDPNFQPWANMKWNWLEWCNTNCYHSSGSQTCPDALPYRRPYLTTSTSPKAFVWIKHRPGEFHVPGWSFASFGILELCISEFIFNDKQGLSAREKDFDVFIFKSAPSNASVKSLKGPLVQCAAGPAVQAPSGVLCSQLMKEIF